MKTHPGVLTNTPIKAQAIESDETHSSQSTIKNSGQQEEKPGVIPEKADNTDLLPISVDSDVTPETTDTA